MSFAARPSISLIRQVWLTLAVLAIAIKILVPPGFMAGAPSNDLPFQIYLCTAQGAVTVASGAGLAQHGDPQKHPAKPVHDSPCAFAGHTVGAAPPTVTEAPPASFFAYAPILSAPEIGLIPGRGLTGPPLPARGPPALLT